MSVRHGFLCSPDDDEFRDMIGTGVAAWQAKVLDGYTYERPFTHDFFSIGYNVVIDGRQVTWRAELGDGEGWSDVHVFDPGSDADRRSRYSNATHLLRPALLPARREQLIVPRAVRAVATLTDVELKDVPAIPAHNTSTSACAEWLALLQGTATITVPPHTVQRVVVDLEDYACAFPELTVSGGAGAMIRVHWAESLYDSPWGPSKGDRQAVDGKYFSGVGDTFLPDGGPSRQFDAPLWRPGRFVELLVRTADEPMTSSESRSSTRATRFRSAGGSTRPMPGVHRSCTGAFAHCRPRAMTGTSTLTMNKWSGSVTRCR
jgi:hypothetical protein